MSDSNCILYADCREQSVLKYKEDLGPVVVEQMTVGDYAVVGPEGNMLAIFERKSLLDAAASLRDGRWANRDKLYQLREQTGCAVLFIIEGSIVRGGLTDPTILCDNCPYGHIESSLMHMMVRDRVSVIWTQSAQDTARTLARFVRSMGTLEAAKKKGSHSPTALLKQKFTMPPEAVAPVMLAELKGVSTKSATEILKRFSIADFITKRRQDELAEFRLADGRRLVKAARDSLANITAADELKMLTAIPGISAATATKILEQAPLAQLITYEPEQLAALKIGKRALGHVRAKDILLYFNMTI